MPNRQHDVIIKGGKLSEPQRFTGESILFNTGAGKYEKYELTQNGAYLTVEYKETISMALNARDIGSFSRRHEDPKTEEPVEKENPVQDTASEVEMPEVDAPIETEAEPEAVQEPHFTDKDAKLSKDMTFTAPNKKTPAKKRKKARK